MLHLDRRTGLPVGEVAGLDSLPDVENVVDDTLSIRVDSVVERFRLGFEGACDRFEREVNIELDCSVLCRLFPFSSEEACRSRSRQYS